MEMPAESVSPPSGITVVSTPRSMVQMKGISTVGATSSRFTAQSTKMPAMRN